MCFRDDDEEKLDEEMESLYRQAYIIIILFLILVVSFITFLFIYTRLY